MKNYSLLGIILFFVSTGQFLLVTPSDQNPHTELFELKPTPIYIPHNIDELTTLVRQASQEQKKIVVVGTDKSQGGQTIADKTAYRIDLSKLSRLINLDTRHKTVTVETGMTWKKLQEILAPSCLAVKVMQSYNDFSIGGSLGVNVHGQDPQAGSIIKSVRSFKLLTATGEILSVSRTENPNLFVHAIGGYGLFGIITEVTLDVTDDILLTRHTTVIPSHELSSYFLQNIHNNQNVLFYSGRFSIGNSDFLDNVLVITYEKYQPQPEDCCKLMPTTTSFISRHALTLLGKYPYVKNWRFFLEKTLLKRQVLISRNNFTNESIASLPSDTDTEMYILQEYFIPYANLSAFINQLKHSLPKHYINLLNITARHVPQDAETVLSYAPFQDACALVLYIKVEKHASSYANVILATSELVSRAIELAGTYYLPYQLIPSKELLCKAYPRFDEFILMKKSVDPLELFSNTFYTKYAK